MDSVDLYVRDVGRYPTLAWEEQLALFRRRPLDVLEDLIQVGNLALMSDIETFELDRGHGSFNFTSKANWLSLLRHKCQHRLIFLWSHFLHQFPRLRNQWLLLRS